MKIIKAFHVTEEVLVEDEMPRVILKHCELGLQVVLSGKVLEAQFQTEYGYLLFLTEDISFEEALHIYLLDQSLSLVEALELSAEYTAGIFRDVHVVDENKISFLFFDDDQSWLLEILKAPKLNLFRHTHPVKRQGHLWDKSRLLLQPLS